MQDGRPIRVVIVDAHQPARSRLGDLVRLHHQLRMVGEAENCEDALQLCQMLEPDVALLLSELSGYLSDTDLKSVQEIVAEISSRIDRFRRRSAE